MPKNQNIITSITKLVLSLVFICMMVYTHSIGPKELITKDQTYTFVASVADVENSSILLDYQVFGSQKRFEEALNTNPTEKLEELKGNGEVLMVKVYGESYVKEFKNGYWYVEDPNAIELNIEYYIVKNLSVANTSLPVHTLYELINDILVKVNKVGTTVVSLVSFVVCLPFAISISKQVYYVIVYFKKKQNTIDAIETQKK